MPITGATALPSWTPGAGHFAEDFGTSWIVVGDLSAANWKIRAPVPRGRPLFTQVPAQALRTSGSMRISLIALDYDGTIALDGRLDSEVRRAIGEARASQILVALVTGRRLDDLQRVAGELHFVDAVVAENGAVLHFPSSGYTTELACPVSPLLLDELSGRRVVHTAGRCIVEAEASDGPCILDAIRTRELPLVMLFNRGRVMVLPQSVSKATGLREALGILRLSLHSTIGIGDAENDHEMLRACEIGVAVAWGSRALRDIADVVLEGSGPPAVAGYIRHLAVIRHIPAVPLVRRRLTLGHADDGALFTLALRGRNVLVAGDARSGKSWVAGLLAEQLILQRYSVCVIDPEGDYRPLEALPGVTVLGGADPLPRPRELLRALRHAETSVVLDLSHVPHREKVQYVHALLPGISRLRQRTGLPHRVVLDEAHYFLDAAEGGDAIPLDEEGFTFATYRASRLPVHILKSSQVVIVTCESDAAEIAALHHTCNSKEPVEAWIAVLTRLAIGEAAVLPVTEETGCRLCRLHLGARLTHHVRHREKYVDIPVPEGHAFVFTHSGRATGTATRTLRGMVEAIQHEGRAVLDGHVRRGDFSRWLADVFGDHVLAATVRQLEHRAVTEQFPDAVLAIADAIRGRYDLLDDTRQVDPSGAPRMPGNAQNAA